MLIYLGCCQEWTPRTVAMRTVNGEALRCCGTANVEVDHRGKQVVLTALVVPGRPLGVDMVLGMAGITALGVISLRTPTDVQFCAAAAAAEVGCQDVVVGAADFVARFSADSSEWTVAWKWARAVALNACATRSPSTRYHQRRAQRTMPSSTSGFARDGSSPMTSGRTARHEH